MAIEETEGGIVVTGEHIRLFNLVRLTGALALEINTGMRMSRGSTMLMAKKACGSRKNTKRGVLLDLEIYIQGTYPGSGHKPLPSVVKALKDVRMSKMLREALGL